jgi:hypothetical protein
VITETVHTETSNHLTYTLSIEPDDLDVRGNALASGDDAEDRRAEEQILARLDNGDTWAWASVTVTAALDVADGAETLTFKGCDHLGACSYGDTADFITENPYWSDLKAGALDDLVRNLSAAVTRGRIASGALNSLMGRPYER